MAEATIIAEWPLNRRETFRVSLSEYNGHPTFDARVWFDDGAGHVKPGKKGITLGMKQLPKLAEALAKARVEAEARRLLAHDGAR
jgi:hypothetical protein